MKALDLQPGKAVFILWEDSASIDGWRHDPVPDVGRISTVGWLVNADNKALVVSTSLNDQFSSICPLSIPWSSITTCIPLEPVWGEEYKEHDCLQRINNAFEIKQEDRELTAQYEKICQEIEKSQLQGS